MDSICILDLTLFWCRRRWDRRRGLVCKAATKPFSAWSTRNHPRDVQVNGGWEDLRLHYYLVTSEITKKRKIPIEYIPHLINDAFFFLKNLYVCHHFFTWYTENSGTRWGTKLCYTIYKIPRSPQLPNTFTTAQEPMKVQCTKNCKHGTINR